MTRKQAFSQLIQQRNWYKNMNIKQNTAATHKKRFLQGKNVSEDFMKRALIAAGYKIIQDEQWEISDCIHIWTMKITPNMYGEEQCIKCGKTRNKLINQ